MFHVGAGLVIGIIGKSFCSVCQLVSYLIRQQHMSSVEDSVCLAADTDEYITMVPIIRQVPQDISM